MNDVNRTLYSTAATPELEAQRREQIETYEKNQRALVAKLQGLGARVILVTPTPYDQTAQIERPNLSGVDDALAGCATFLRRLAAETGSTLVDFHEPMNRLAAPLHAKDPHWTFTRGDRVHPDAPWHFVMAYLFLKAQDVPSEVAHLSLDAADDTKFSATNSRVENVRRAGNTLEFTWRENALPFPVSKEVAPALSQVPFTADFNREMLQIAHLAPGRYALQIDGHPIATFSADQLAQGVNLAEQTSTPQAQQAAAVAELLHRRTQLVGSDLRGIALIELQVAPELPHPVTLEQMEPYLQKKRDAVKAKPAATSAPSHLDLYPERKAREAASRAEAARLLEEARRAATPKPHAYRLTPAPAD
jgi:hypothetical protein